MKITYDPKADAMYIQFQKEKYSISKEVGKGMIVDYTESGEVIGIEILEASKRMPIESIQEITISVPSIKETAFTE
jgi:uncharacterized protein YuzE